jgi:hypothetical protein
MCGMCGIFVNPGPPSFYIYDWTFLIYYQHINEIFDRLQGKWTFPRSLCRYVSAAPALMVKSGAKRTDVGQIAWRNHANMW